MRFFICSEWPKLCIGLLRIYYSFPNAGGKLLGFIFGGKGRFPGKSSKRIQNEDETNSRSGGWI